MWDERFEAVVRNFLPFLPENGELRPELSLRDFGMDSIAMIDLLAALEREYRVRFASEALNIENFQTPSTVWAALSSMVSAPSR
ncbi:acyl carrier protein [Streptosporangium sp. DT93]|uniref:acyl carrier protein n=1 Tax=Streptosporangium sp. DT93 TaxID=3393428 RepID=UPI003CF306CC